MVARGRRREAARTHSAAPEAPFAKISTTPRARRYALRVLRRKAFWLCLGVFACAGSVAVAAPGVSRRWQDQRTPAAGTPSSIGDYSAGCVQGAQPLALSGEGYLVMHPSRLRYFGHPALIAFLQALGHSVHAQGLGVVLIGDLSQPRGGRAPGGHASHQTGLDVDLWYWQPKQAAKGALSDAERESLKARSVLDGLPGKEPSIQARLVKRVRSLLQLTAEQPGVERVFVHPIIKRTLCAEAGSERAWLGKLRPWYGHDDHFHVRLACPADSPQCTPQAPVPAGDGCGELDFWFSEAAQKARAQGRKEYETKVAHPKPMPAACATLLQ